MNEKTNDIDVERCIALSNNRHLIGEDADGRGHFYSPALETLWVKKPAKDSLVVAYRTRDLGAWRDYVAERTGWSWHNISSESTPELVATALKQADA